MHPIKRLSSSMGWGGCDRGIEVGLGWVSAISFRGRYIDYCIRTKMSHIFDSKEKQIFLPIAEFVTVSVVSLKESQ